MRSYRPPCFETEVEWRDWLALFYQSGHLKRLREYPVERRMALLRMIELLEEQRKFRVLAGVPTGDIDRLLEDHRASIETAENQTTELARKRFNFCIDCTQCHRNKMIKAGLCVRPSTRFVANYSPLTGDVEVEGDPLIDVGRVDAGTDPHGTTAYTRAGISFPQRAEVAV